jgi:hypothetical protein
VAPSTTAIGPIIPLRDAAWLLWRHWRDFGSLANPWRPRSLNDRILRRLILQPHPMDARLCCKLGQRAFKAERIGAAASPPLLGVWDTADALASAWDGLPESFMLKPTHGSGWYRTVPDRAAADRGAILAQAAGWLGQSYWRVASEVGYRDVVPRLVVEPLLAPVPGYASPREFQAYCFDGRIAFTMTRLRMEKGTSAVAFLDAEGHRLPVTKGGRAVDPLPDPDPATWARIRDMSGALSRGFDFLRCDFLVEGDTVWASELTPYPSGGRQYTQPRDWILWLGEVWGATQAGRPWPDPPAAAPEARTP